MNDVRRRRLAVLTLAPLVAVGLVCALVVPLRAASSIDSRTQIEMIRGISLHGLPYLYNGPTGQYPDLQTAWNILHDGKLWGNYPPLYAYTAAPFFMLAGLRGVSALSMLLMSVLAVGVYKLGARFTKDPLAGTAAAYVTLLSTPSSVASLDILPFMLCIALFTWAAYFAVTSLDERGRRARVAAFLAGLLAALSTAAHLVTFPMVAAMLAVLLAAPAPEEVPLTTRGLLALLGTTRSSLARGAFAAGGAIGPYAATGALNKMRFGSYNPLSYGPCVWHRCNETGLFRQSAGAMIAYAAPVFSVIALTIVASYLLRKRREASVGVAAVGLAVLWYGPPEIREHATGLWTIARGYLIDCTDIPMMPMVNAPDGMGTFWGPYVIKSTLQSSPLFGAALAVPFATARDKRLALALALPCAGIFLLLAMRAVVPTVHALGFPWLYMRYAMPAWPLLSVLAVAALKDLPWTWRRVAIMAVVSAIAVTAFALQGDDLWYPRRVLILRGSLLAVILGALLPYMKKAWVTRARLEVASAAFVMGCAFTCGIDVNATVGMRFHNEEHVAAITRATPERLALVGYSQELDIPLTLRATRDVEYADLSESPDWSNFRKLIDYWYEHDRPIYLFFPSNWRHEDMKSRWPEIEFVLLDPKWNFYRVVRH